MINRIQMSAFQLARLKCDFRTGFLLLVIKLFFFESYQAVSSRYRSLYCFAELSQETFLAISR